MKKNQTIVKTIFILLGLSLILSQPAFTQESTEELPKEKQTTLGLYVTSAEAYDMWKADPEKVKILDVRTPEEYFM